MKIQKLKTENSVNRALRHFRKDKSKTYLLFTSPWDKRSSAVKDYIKDLGSEETVYEVSYYDVPESYLNFKVQPGTLVRLQNDSVVIYPGLNAVKIELN